MSAKRTKMLTVTCWKYCENCKCQYIASEEECHTEICSVSNACANTILTILKELPGTIFYGKFHGCISSVKGKGIVPEDTVFLHPTTMQILKIPFSGCISRRAVLLNGRFIGYVKEDRTMLPQCIGLVETVADKLVDKSVTIEIISEDLTEADTVLLASESMQLDKDETLLSVAHHLFENRILAVNSSIPVKWLFSVVNLVAINITTESGELSSSAGQNSFEKQFQNSLIDLPDSNHFSSSFVSYKESQRLFKITLRTKLKWYKEKNVIKETQCYESIQNRLCGLINNVIQSDAHTGRGVLLYSPTGSGKKYIARSAVSKSKCASFVEVSCSEIISRYKVGGGKSVESFLLQSVTASSSSSSSSSNCCCVLLPRIDILCQRSDRVKSESKNLCQSVISSIDLLLNCRKHRVVLISTSLRRLDLDAELLTSGRLSVDIEIKAPTSDDRFTMLMELLSKTTNNLNESDVRLLANDAHGLWAWHVVDLVRNARILCERSLSAGSNSSKEDNPRTDSINIELQDLLGGFAATRKKLSSIAVKPVKWSDIGGQLALKQSVIEAIEAPYKHINKYRECGMEPVKGILLYGPPGCSKTMIAKAIATQCSVNFFSVQGSELLSCYYGESERNIRDVFTQARRSAPSVIFFDEIDAIGGSRGKSGGSATSSMMQSLLAELDGVDALNNVTIIAATNRPQSMDKALLRPGRLDRKIYVRLPDADSRREIMEIECERTRVESERETIERLVQKTEGFSCAEVVHVFNEARMAALCEDIENASTLCSRHFDQALLKVTPGTDLQTLKIYEDFEGQKSY